MSIEPLLHLTARTLPGIRPFANPHHAWWMWHRLRVACPNALAACLMPNHFHVICSGRPRTAWARMCGAVSGFTRHVAEQRIWQCVAEPQVIPDRDHLARQVRYVHLNPCRAGLVDDPLRWPWSTHRGVIGAEVDPWVSAARLARALRWEREGFESRLHAYVSGDPAVDVSGTPFPASAPMRSWPTLALDRIVRAALSATPWSSGAERRRAIAALAASQGFADSDVLARLIGVTPRSVRRFLDETVDANLSAPRLCLGDERLVLEASAIKQRGNAAPKAAPPWSRTSRT